MRKKAICLFSGGLDSTTALYYALQDRYEVTALSIHYGQTHDREILGAREIAKRLGIKHHETSIDLPWGGSSLIDPNLSIPMGRDETSMKDAIPNTYVPARNTIFLSLAASLAETVEAEAIFIGANALDYSGYPDCRPEYMQAMQEVTRLGTKQGVEGTDICILTPLIHMSKQEIVLLAHELKVPLELTWSCYKGGEEPCQQCDSCTLRAKGFKAAHLSDPLLAHEVSSSS